MKNKKVVVVGTFDTKGVEYDFLITRLKQAGCQVKTVNTGILQFEPIFQIDIDADMVARAAGVDLSTLQKNNDRGKAIAAMSEGAASLIRHLYEKEDFDAIIGMGGTAGTNIVAAAMRGLPFGMPKICLSTVASGDVSPYIGITDIVVMPSLTDIAGINSISRITISNACGALLGMLSNQLIKTDDALPVIAASMFGNTTPCVNRCREMLSSKGFDVLVFHATGTGGKTMEKLVYDGVVHAVLDITTTEWADTICGGVFDAGEERLDAPGQMGIPHLIVPGCIDMCNFGSKDTIPSKYNDRLFYQWNPNVTLMRTTAEENSIMGEKFATKANHSKGRVKFLIPMKGFSMLDALNEQGDPQLFWSPEADNAFVEGLQSKLNQGIEIMQIDANINDPEFADKAVEVMISMM